ncbi:MAG TPA: hypothetical protein VN911_18730 [Candidatus Acidoferrum sp.]|nr:hypothetical protein [Candidatus Acidoferrum sp.]
MRLSFLSAVLFLSTITLAFGQDTNFPAGPQYLRTGSPLFALPIATPTLAITGPPLQTGADTATADLIAGAGNRTEVPQSPPPPNLYPIYYGEHWVREVEGSSAEPPSELPPTEFAGNFLNTEVEEASIAQTLRARGNIVVYRESGSYPRARVPRLARVYTNADINRLRGGS